MKRLFLALWPDHRIRSELEKMIENLDPLKLKKVNPENLHVTLVFIGSVEDTMVSMINQRMSTISAKAFTVAFDELCYWRKPKVLCLTSAFPPAEIMRLAETINISLSDLDFKLDTRPYRPHVTLARKARYRPELEFPPVQWHANSFCLVESVTHSEGVFYQVIRTWRFEDS